MVSALLAAADCAAVLAGMKEFGADPSRFTIISLKGRIDGCAVVLFSRFCAEVINDEPCETGCIVLFTIVNVIGMIAFGLLYLFVAVMILKLCWEKMPVVVSRCITAPSFCYDTGLSDNRP